MGVIVTITTGGPVAMETGGSGGWGRDKRVYTHTEDIQTWSPYYHAQRDKRIGARW